MIRRVFVRSIGQSLREDTSFLPGGARSPAVYHLIFGPLRNNSLESSTTAAKTDSPATYGFKHRKYRSPVAHRRRGGDAGAAAALALHRRADAGGSGAGVRADFARHRTHQRTDFHRVFAASDFRGGVSHALARIERRRAGRVDSGDAGRAAGGGHHGRGHLFSGRLERGPPRCCWEYSSRRPIRFP